jgi:hypothetical protein
MQHGLGRGAELELHGHRRRSVRRGNVTRGITSPESSFDDRRLAHGVWVEDEGDGVGAGIDVL